MIFDSHTHLALENQVRGSFADDGVRVWGKDYIPYCTPEMHRKNMQQCDGAIVMAMDARLVGYCTANETVAEYVSEDPDRLFGFAGVDPNRENAVELLRHAVCELGLKGLKLGPIYQGFNPLSPEAGRIYAEAEKLGIPILWHMGTSFVHNGPLEYSHPLWIDPIARSYPSLKMIIAHLAHPWYEVAACVVRKNPNVYADMSALFCRPWQFYNTMVSVMEYGIQDKVFFGTDYPTFDVRQTVESFRHVNDLVEGTRMPRVPEKVIEEIIHRDTPGILGLRK